MNTFDVAIVGGGVIGSSIAFQAAAEKLRVVVLDSQQPGQEASWAAAGMLSPAPDTPRDLPLVPLAKESLALYPDFIAALESESGLPTAYGRPGTMEVFVAPEGRAECDRMLAQHRQLGLPAEPVSLHDARKLEAPLAPDATAAAWLPAEGSVEPRLLMAALLQAAGRRGVQLRAHAHVTSLLLDERKRCTGVVCAGERISAKYVVVAAGCFSARTLGDLARYAPTRPVRGQMLALRALGSGIGRILRSRRAYLVPRPDGRIVAGSTLEDQGFEKRVTPAGMRKIIEGALQLIPSLANAEILETWSGLRPGTPDDLPILGPTDVDALIVATGHYRNGILLAPVTAKLVVEWMTRRTLSFDAAAFSPLRFGPRRVESNVLQATETS